jgi:excinuclease UvrABC ATPase subunit
MLKKDNQNQDKIIVKGARTHNLKNINVEIPRNKMVVITGMSGSGKSSLAFDTIFRRRAKKICRIIICLRKTVFKSNAKTRCR